MKAQNSLHKKITDFVKKEVVLCIAAVLAVVSMFFVPPDGEYPGYIDFRVLAILFTLMTVMAGLTQIGFFDKIAHVMLKKADDYRKLSFIMVFLCFFSSMFITNDVALITFVPFTLLMLSLAGLKEQAVSLVVYETIAANLGSMLTPVGNPQNLYLYTASGMGIGEFLRITAPIAGVSAILLAVCCMRSEKKPVHIEGQCTGSAGTGDKSRSVNNKIELCFYGIVFLLALLTVLRILPVWIPLLAAIIGTLIVRWRVLLKVDYCLLITFVSFFVFIGNMGRIEMVRQFLEEIMAGRELLIAFFSSQVISNVPAAVLLSGFTEEYAALIRGTNIGGLGTLIASLASLISYKAFTQENPEKKGKYFAYFTLMNVIFAVILLVFTLVIT